MSVFRLPDVGEGLQEAEIVAWHVSPGDRVVADQPLVSIETDKAVVEIPSPRSGRIKALYGEVGDILPVGADLAEFDDEGRADKGAVVGELPQTEDDGSKAPEAPQPQTRAATARVKASLPVRKLATELGVDLETVAGSGPQGSITSDDVRAAAGSGAGPAALRGARRTMARAMASAGREVVPATIQDRADITRWPDGTDATVRLIRAMQAGVEAEPNLNASFDGTRLELRPQEHIGLGIAMDTGEGLFVPVLRDPGKLDDGAVRSELERLKKVVMERSAAPAELSGQTITLSNFGMIAGRHVTLVVVPPQVAILGAGTMGDDVVAVDGQPEVRRILPLSLTFDHRALTGGEAARFMAAVIEDLERSETAMTRAAPDGGT